MRKIDTIVIHCSATPNGVYVSPAQIDAWHAARGFHRDPAAVADYRPSRALGHIGYHWVITPDGRQHTGRSTEEVGAHVAGHNEHTIGICMVGMDQFFLAQWDMLAGLLCDLAFIWQSDRLLPYQRVGYPLSPALAISQLALMGISIVGHRDLSPDINGDGKITSIDWVKKCPCFDVATWLSAEMLPDGEELLDGHPAIASPEAADRVLEPA